ncbi:hypothetical protein [Sphingobacterium sp. DR205]|uniref:hypothetical protein n=1 Tax=Sphingobacterium sp. DR205 TaxID=2713573 RepID=UPI0013E41C5A|nr:hypothetical protein [Sphingobacterium sp. DR205]QIH33499.1 hypothetical protein G6053_11640 [Sphingobacterium sp. DR205]
MKKIFLALTAITLSTVVFAETKGENPSKTESTAKATTYWVVGISGTNYILSSSPNPDCGNGNEMACEITSQNALTNNLAPINQVEAETNGFTVIEKQPHL